MAAPSTPEAFVDAYARVQAANRVVLDKLARALRLFEREGIDVILLKGADLVTRPDVPQGVRPLGDVDLLVHERDLPRLEAAALTLGLRQTIDGNPSFLDEEGCLWLDCATEVWYLPDDGPVWDRARTREAGGARVKTMAPEDALLFDCLWVCLHRGCFSAAFAEDVRILAGSGEIAWSRVRAEAEALGLRAPLFHALSYAALKRPGCVPPAELEALAPASALEKIQVLLLRRLVGEARLEGLSHLLVLLSRPRGSRLSALRASLFPDDRFLRYRYGTAGTANRILRPFRLAAQALALVGRVFARLLTP